jgi:hypothetical protein
MTDRTKRILGAGLFLIAGALCIRCFFDVGKLYADFRPVLGRGVRSLPKEELVYSAWFMFLGSLAALALSFGLYRTRIPPMLQDGFAAVTRRSRVLLGVLPVAVFLVVAGLRAFVLLDAPVADDESTYVFIAQTLRSGHVTNPLPEDKELFANHFVVMNEHGWFGKYPIGHPLVLAAADLVGARFFVGPFLTALSLLLTFAVGRRLYGERTALLALLLLTLSPHFLLTGATLLSQTTATVCMLSGLFFAVQFMESGRTRAGALAGVCFAYGALARPLPGGLFALAAFAVIVFQPDGGRFLDRVRRQACGLGLFVAFGAVAAGVLLLVNWEQTGHVFRTAYHEVHGAGMGIADVVAGQRSMSVAAALLRENLWLFGWPVSLLFIGFVRRNRYFPLLAALLAAEIIYRVVVPKTVVASTGPIYMTEIVPLLALATASGMVEAKNRLATLGVRSPEGAIISGGAALTLVAVLCFWPLQLSSLHAGARWWRFPYRALAEQHASQALVFSDRMVNAALGATWAYHPPNPSPALDDEVLFVRVPSGTVHPIAAMREFRQRRYPDRPAFVLQLEGTKAALLPLDALSEPGPPGNADQAMRPGP